MGEVQGSVNLLQIQSSESQDPPPDASFSDAGKSKGESKGIVSILTMLKEDCEDEIANGVKAEAEDQSAFEDAVKKIKATLKRLDEKKTSTKDSMATNEQSSDDTEDQKDDAKQLKTDDEEYLSEIKPDCDWMLTNFDARKSGRDQEAEGLKEAKAALLGGVQLMQVSARKHQAFLAGRDA